LRAVPRDRRLADAERPRIHHRDGRFFVEDDQAVSACGGSQAVAEEVLAPGQTMQVDADGPPFDRVQRMDEGMLSRAVIERVGPPPVAARHARYGIPAHLLAGFSLVDDRLAKQSATAYVIGPNDVAGRISPRHVLDEIEQSSLR
jgi:hypothetical protein